MCDKAKGYLSVLREYSHEVIMFLGFGIAFLVYADNKEQTKEFMQQMQSMTSAMNEITIRLHDLEKKIDDSNK